MAGTVYWITGLSGAGKTTIGSRLFARLKQDKSNVVFLDGNALREIFGNDLGHTIEDRRISAMRNARLCATLTAQDIDVVCATISMFHDCRNWNREHIQNYREIYLKVPMDILIQRDQFQLYSKTLNGEAGNVWGLDIDAEEPESPDLIIDNHGDMTPEQALQIIADKFL